MDLINAIHKRRTVKVFSGSPVGRDLVRQLVEAAVTAPNHRLTQPWRFAAIDAEGVARLVVLVQTPPLCQAVEARKLAAICERMARCGAMVQVTCQRSADPERQREDLAATAAAVQNLLLAATGLGLGSFWSTSPLMAHAGVLSWFGADPGQEAHVATVWLGHPAESPPPPRRRPVDEVLRWV
jgi:nitroreductase